MTEAPKGDAPPFKVAGIDELARDWLTIWESELASLSADREIQEFWARLVAVWAEAATAIRDGVRYERGEPNRSPARAAAAGAAPDAGDVALERLDRRLAGIEARLAALESEFRAGGGAARGGTREREQGRPGRGGVPPRRSG